MATVVDSNTPSHISPDAGMPASQSDTCDSSSNCSGSGKRLKRWVSLGEAPKVSEVLMCGHRVIPTSTIMVNGEPHKFVLVRANNDRRSWLTSSFGWMALPNTFEPTLVTDIITAFAGVRGKRTCNMWKGARLVSDVTSVIVRGRAISILNRSPPGGATSGVFIVADVGTIAWFTSEWYTDINKTILAEPSCSGSSPGNGSVCSSPMAESLPEPFDHFDVDTDMFGDDLGDDMCDASDNDDTRVRADIVKLKCSDKEVYWLASKHAFKSRSTKCVVGVPRTNATKGDYASYLADLKYARDRVMSR